GETPSRDAPQARARITRQDASEQNRTLIAVLLAGSLLAEDLQQSALTDAVTDVHSDAHANSHSGPHSLTHRVLQSVGDGLLCLRRNRLLGLRRDGRQCLMSLRAAEDLTGVRISFFVRHPL